MKADASFKPSPVTYRILTKCLINAGRIEDARNILFEMLCTVHPDYSVYNNLISGYLQTRNLDKANELIDVLKRWCPYYYYGFVNAAYMDWFFTQGRNEVAMDSYKSLLNRKCTMKPDSGNALLRVLFKHGKKTEAWDLFHDMLDNHTPPTFYGVNSGTFIVMVDECLKLGEVDEALAALKKVGTKPDSRPFFLDIDGNNKLISTFCEYDMLSEAESVFQEMYSMSMIPDVHTHTTLVDTYLKVGRVNDAMMICDKMAEADLKPVI